MVPEFSPLCATDRDAYFRYLSAIVACANGLGGAECGASTFRVGDRFGFVSGGVRRSIDDSSIARCKSSWDTCAAGSGVVGVQVSLAGEIGGAGSLGSGRVVGEDECRDGRDVKHGVRDAVHGSGGADAVGQVRSNLGSGQFRRGPNFEKNQAKRDRRRERKKAIRQQGECGKPVWKSVRVEARKMHEAAKVLAHGDVTVQNHGPNHARNVANREAQKVVKREEEQQRKLEFQKMKDLAAMARENRCSSCVMNDDRCEICHARHVRDVAVTNFQAAKAAADLEQLKKLQSEGRYLWRENQVGGRVNERVAGFVNTIVSSSSESRQSTPDSVPSLKSGSVSPRSSASIPHTVAACADVLHDLVVSSGPNLAEAIGKMDREDMVQIMPAYIKDAIAGYYGISVEPPVCGVDGFGSEDFYD